MTNELKDKQMIHNENFKNVIRSRKLENLCLFLNLFNSQNIRKTDVKI
jgi:hypothetical protein